jgi:glucose-6-phosphate 1-epimerase
VNTNDTFKGQPAVHLRTSNGDSATVLLHGGHVVSWIPAGGNERLYLSDLSAYGDGHPVRGGVPVIFPQFNQRGPDFSLPRHGFARTRAWVVAPQEAGEAGDPTEATAAAQAAVVTLRLTDDAETRALWPHGFSLALTVRLAPRRLELTLTVVNEGAASFAFTAALHTYLRVADIRQAGLFGLQGVRYLDTVTGIGTVGGEPPLTFDRETDRIYYEVPDPLLLRTPESALEVTMDGFRDAVVWNPWAERCAALPDMPDEDYLQMLCIEAALIDKPGSLQAGEIWVGRQTLVAS